MQQIRIKFIFILKHWYIIFGNTLIPITTITYYSLHSKYVARAGRCLAKQKGWKLPALS